MIATLSWFVFGLGALICLLNFYLSFLRYPIHRMRGLPRESFRWSSGFPLIGSLFVVLSLIGLHAQTDILPASIVLIAIDTGGIHWFAGSMLYQSFHAKKRT
jgi:hypothetical protein